MEEAAGSEASFCLQSILPPPEYFPPPFPPPQYFLPPRLRRAAGGCGAPRGPAGSPPQGASGAGGASPQRSCSPPSVLILPRRGTPGAASAAAFFLGGGSWGRAGRGRRAALPVALAARWEPGQDRPSGRPAGCQVVSQSKGGKSQKTAQYLVASFCGLLPLEAKKGQYAAFSVFCLFFPHLPRQ